LVQQTERHPSVPETILKVAFQPTARGGKLHFVAGNIRFVSAARDLIDPDAREDLAADPWMLAYQFESDEGEEDNGWQAWLEYKYHIDDQNRGNIKEEQLLIEGQQMYTCPVCQGDNWL
jgi:hypothetical protein